MRKWAGFLSVILFLSIALPTQAAPLPIHLTLEQSLLLQGYPEKVVAQMSSANKEALVQGHAVYRNHTFSNEPLYERPAQNLTPQSLANFSHMIVLSQVPSGAPGRADFLVTYDWAWNYQPIFTLTDKFGLAWSGGFDLLTDYADSATYGYTVFGVDVETGQSYDAQSYQWTGQDQYTPGAGIGWSYDMMSSFWSSRNGHYCQYQVYRHQGWAQVRIGQYPGGQQHQSSVSAKYFHHQLQLGNPSFTFTTTGRPSVGISPSWGFDESTAAVTSFYWPS